MHGYQYNITREWGYQSEWYFSFFIASLAVLLAMIGNIGLLMGFRCLDRLRNRYNLLHGSLAFLDIFFCFMAIIWMVSFYNWTSPPWMQVITYATLKGFFTGKYLLLSEVMAFRSAVFYSPGQQFSRSSCIIAAIIPWLIGILLSTILSVSDPISMTAFSELPNIWPSNLSTWLAGIVLAISTLILIVSTVAVCYKICYKNRQVTPLTIGVAQPTPNANSAIYTIFQAQSTSGADSSVSCASIETSSIHQSDGKISFVNLGNISEGKVNESCTESDNNHDLTHCGPTRKQTVKERHARYVSNEPREPSHQANEHLRDDRRMLVSTGFILICFLVSISAIFVSLSSPLNEVPLSTLSSMVALYVLLNPAVHPLIYIARSILLQQHFKQMLLPFLFCCTCYRRQEYHL